MPPSHLWCCLTQRLFFWLSLLGFQGSSANATISALKKKIRDILHKTNHEPSGHWGLFEAMARFLYWEKRTSPSFLKADLAWEIQKSARPNREFYWESENQPF